MTTYQTYSNHTSFSRPSRRQNDYGDQLYPRRDVSRKTNIRSGQLQHLTVSENLHEQQPWNRNNQQAFHHLGMAHEIMSHPDPRNMSQLYSAALANLHMAAQYLNSATLPLAQPGASSVFLHPTPVPLQQRGPGSSINFPVSQRSLFANPYQYPPLQTHSFQHGGQQRTTQAPQGSLPYPPNSARHPVSVTPNLSTDGFRRVDQSQPRYSHAEPPATAGGEYEPMNIHNTHQASNVQNPTTPPRMKFRHRITGEDVTAIKVESYDPTTCSCCKGKWYGCQKCKFNQIEMAKNMQQKPVSPPSNEAPDLVTVSPSSPNRSSSEASIRTPTPRDSTEVAWVEDENGNFRIDEHKRANSSIGEDSAVPTFASGPSVDVDSRDADWFDVSYACDDEDYKDDIPRGRSRSGNKPRRKYSRSPSPPPPASIAIATTRLVKLPNIPSLPQVSCDSKENLHTSTELASSQVSNPIKECEEMQHGTSKSPKRKEISAIQTDINLVSDGEGYSDTKNPTCKFATDQSQLKMDHSPVLPYSRPPCHSCSQFGHYSSFCPVNGRNVETKASTSLCWNCWESKDHNYYTCPNTRLSWLQREELRIKIGAKMTDAYKAKIGSGLSLQKAQANMPSNTSLSSQMSPQTKEKTVHSEQAVTSLDSSKASSLPSNSNDASDSSRTLKATSIINLPPEILDQIFEYVAGQAFSSFLFLDDSKSNEVANGAYTLSILENCLGSARRTCKHWRMVAQRQIYKSIYINDITSYYKFVQSILDAPELSSFVQSVKIELQQSSPSYVKWTQNGSRNKQKGPCIYRAAWRLYELLGACTNLVSISANFYGAIKAFDFLDDHYPKLKRLTIEDENDTGQSAKNLWRNLQRCPSLEEFTITHTKKNRQADYSNLGISPSKQIWYLDYQYQSLKVLKLIRCPEVSDAILLVLLKRMGALRRLHIDECKLLTSSGLGRALAKIPGQLHHLQYINWCDQQGMTTDIESELPDHHLCLTIRNSCSSSLRSLKLSPYRVCSDLLEKSSWPHLQKCEIEQMTFKGCSERDTLRTFGDSTKTMAMPNLRWPFKARLGLPHISFH